MLGDQDWRRTHGWHCAASLEGWSNNDLGFQWLCSVFDPQPRLPNCQHRLLILDGHGSHLSAWFCCYCHDHDIDLLLLPSHTSHVLQPLDVGVFKERKKVICQAAKDRWRLLADGDRLSKRDFILDLAEAREKAMTGEHIIKGWEATGLHPLISDKVSPYPDPNTPVSALSLLAARCCLQNTDSLKAGVLQTNTQTYLAWSRG
jgi:hypothetical protein